MKFVLLNLLVSNLAIAQDRNTYVQLFNSYIYPSGKPTKPQSGSSYNENNQWGMFMPKRNGLKADTLFHNGKTYIHLPDSFPRYAIVNLADTFDRNYNGTLTGPALGGGSAMIAIKDINDKSGGIEPGETRSRSELRFVPRHYDKATNSYRAQTEGDNYYFSYSMFIPNDNSYTDKELSWARKEHHIIFQFHEVVNNIEFDQNGYLIEADEHTSKPEPGNVSPPFKMKLIHENNKKDNLRDLTFSYGYDETHNVKSHRTSHIYAKDAVEKGVWNRFIFHVNWHSRDDIGYIEIWVNGKKMVTNPKNRKNPHNPNYNLKGDPKYPRKMIIDSLVDITKIYGANIAIDQTRVADSIKIPNWIQMGHYKNIYDDISTFYIDDFMVSQDADLIFRGLSTSLKKEFKNKTIDKNNLKIDFYKVPKAIQYRLCLMDENFVKIYVDESIDGSASSIDFSSEKYKPFLKSGTYQITMAAKLEGETSFRPYGEATKVIIKTTNE